MISSIKGTVRGGHYHKNTVEIFIIIDGKIEVSTQKVEAEKLVGKPCVSIVSAGDVFLIEPLVLHTFKCLEDSRWINMLSKKMNQETPDFYRPRINNKKFI